MFNLKNTLLAAVAAIVAINLIVLGAYFFADTVSPSKVFAYAIVTALILVLPALALLQGAEILRLLRSLEPKASSRSVTYRYGSEQASAKSDKEWELSQKELELAHRRNMELSAASSLAHTAVQPHIIDTKAVGKKVKEALDGLLLGKPRPGFKCLTHGVEDCPHHEM